MRYKEIKKGIFLSRPNRFIAIVAVDGKEETVHVKNTGRCKELLVPGCTAVLSVSDNPQRKTKYDLIAVYKKCACGERLINMDSQVPNDVAEEWVRSCGMFSEDAVIKREVTHGDSRFDIYVDDSGRETFIEVKGVTLEEDGVCRFPDAPTQRGVKHLRGLADALDEGYDTAILFVIQMKDVSYLEPNAATHPQFADTLRMAASKGVRVMAIDCTVEEDSIVPGDPVMVKL